MAAWSKRRPLGVDRGWMADQLLERLAADADVQAEDARTVQVRGGVEARVVLVTIVANGMRRSVGESPSGSQMKNESPQATSGAPVASLAVTTTTPGSPVTNAMISSCVMRRIPPPRDSNLCIPSIFSLKCYVRLFGK
jgi:hypothetical protein